METKKQIGSAIWRMNQTLMEVSEALEENGGELTPEIEEKLQESELSQVEVADGIKTLMGKVKAEDAILADEIKRLQALKKARANALDGLKKYLLDYMLTSGTKKIEAQYCTVTVANGPESVVCEEEKLLGAFEQRLLDLQDSLPPYITVDMKVNKTALKDYLKQDGAVVPTIKEGNVEWPAAALVRNPHLLIK